MALRPIKSILALCFSLFILLQPTNILASEPAAATAEHANKEEGSFNVTETILEHIKDDHSWHLWGHTSIHLPIFFSSLKVITKPLIAILKLFYKCN